MKGAAAAVLAAVLAGCAAPPPGVPAPLTIYGRELRLETWRAVVVDRGHFHADLTDYPCPMSDLLRLTDFMAVLNGKTAKTLSDSMGSAMGGMMDSQCVRGPGPTYGGPERLVLGLLRFGEDPKKPLEAVVVDCPRLKPGERERLFQAGDLAAAWERPPKSVEASLKRGWVRVLRKDAIPDDPMPSYEFEVFLVLARDGAPGESIQIVARAGPDAR